jgi:hypothetical protein
VPLQTVEANCLFTLFPAGTAGNPIPAWFFRQFMLHLYPLNIVSHHTNPKGYGFLVNNRQS